MAICILGNMAVREYTTNLTEYEHPSREYLPIGLKPYPNRKFGDADKPRSLACPVGFRFGNGARTPVTGTEHFCLA